MNLKSIKKSILIIIIFLLIILSVIIFHFKKKENTNKTLNIENNPNIETTPETKKEILIEDISIFIPSLQEECSIDNCMTNKTFLILKNYFIENKYEEIIKDNLIYYKSPSNLIKLTLYNENDNVDTKTQNNEEYDYIFNRYTTKDDLIKILNNQNIQTFTGEEAQNIAVLNYHFFYDSKTETCTENICLDISNFEKQLSYLKENNFKTLTIDEYYNWMYGEIILPKNSVLITIDDGAMGTSKINGNKLIPLLEKYEINATLFLITGWWDKENYESSYLDIQSHTHLMHDENICSNQTRGAEMLCKNKEDIIKDLNKSLSIVDNNTAFCYPFYLYDNKSIEALKELNFKLAFIGGNKKSNQNNDKFKIPRYIIYKTTSLNSFKSMVN